MTKFGTRDFPFDCLFSISPHCLSACAGALYISYSSRGEKTRCRWYSYPLLSWLLSHIWIAHNAIFYRPRRIDSFIMLGLQETEYLQRAPRLQRRTLQGQKTLNHTFFGRIVIQIFKLLLVLTTRMVCILEMHSINQDHLQSLHFSHIENASAQYESMFGLVLNLLRMLHNHLNSWNDAIASKRFNYS